jgi:hypothetical protein
VRETQWKRQHSERDTVEESEGGADLVQARVVEGQVAAQQREHDHAHLQWKRKTLNARNSDLIKT